MKDLCPTDNLPHNFIPVGNGYYKSGETDRRKGGGRKTTRVKVVPMACTKCCKSGYVLTGQSYKVAYLD